MISENAESAINNFGSKVVIDTFNNRVFNHEVFQLSNRLTVPGNTTVKVVFDPTENGVFPFKALVQLPFIVKGYNGGPINIDIYAGVDSDPDGTVLEVTDKNLLDPVTPHSVLRLDPTINNDGVKSPIENTVYSFSGGFFTASNADESEEKIITVLDPSIRYSVHLINTSADDASCLVRLKWFESD